MLAAMSFCFSSILKGIFVQYNDWHEEEVILDYLFPTDKEAIGKLYEKCPPGKTGTANFLKIQNMMRMQLYSVWTGNMIILTPSTFWSIASFRCQLLQRRIDDILIGFDKTFPADQVQNRCQSHSC